MAVYFSKNKMNIIIFVQVEEEVNTSPTKTTTICTMVTPVKTRNSETSMSPTKLVDAAISTDALPASQDAYTQVCIEAQVRVSQLLSVKSLRNWLGSYARGYSHWRKAKYWKYFIWCSARIAQTISAAFISGALQPNFFGRENWCEPSPWGDEMHCYYSAQQSFYTLSLVRLWFR